MGAYLEVGQRLPPWRVMRGNFDGILLGTAAAVEVLHW